MAGELVVRVAARLDELKKNLAEGVTQIETTKNHLRQMSNAYDGSRIISQAGATVAAIGGIQNVSKLTATEQARVNRILDEALAKYKALGKDAPPAMIALHDATKRVEDTSRKGVSAIRELGDGAGGANNKFGQLREGASQVDRVLASMGINIGPQVSALNELSVASGKSASQLGLVATAGLALAAGAAGWQIGSLIAQYTQADEALGDWLASVVGWSPAAQEAAAVTDVLARASANAGREITNYAEAIKINEEAARQRSSQFIDFEKDLLRAQVAVSGLTEDEWDQIAAAQELGRSTEWLKAKFGLTADEITVVRQRLSEKTAAEKEAAQESAKHSAALLELKSAGDGWRGTLAGIKADTIDEIKGFLDAGVAQGVLQTAYQLTATQVKAIATALQEEKKAHEESERAAEKHAQTVQKATEMMAQLWTEHNMALLESSLSTHTVLLARIEEWKQKQIAAAQEAGLLTEEVQAQIAAAAAERYEREKVDIEGIRQYSRTYLQEQADEARATYEYVLQHATEFSQTFIEQKRLEAEAARQSAEDWGTAFTSTMNTVRAKANDTSDALIGSAQRAALTWSQAMSLVAQGKGTMTMTVVGQPISNQPWGKRAEGGPVEAGKPYIVGEKRPELFIPERDGMILPSVPPSFGGAGSMGMSGGGVVHITNHIHVAGSVIAERDLARTVGDAMMSRWLASGGRNASRA